MQIFDTRSLSDDLQADGLDVAIFDHRIDHPAFMFSGNHPFQTSAVCRIVFGDLFLAIGCYEAEAADVDGVPEGPEGGVFPIVLIT